MTTTAMATPATTTATNTNSITNADINAPNAVAGEMHFVVTKTERIDYICAKARSQRSHAEYTITAHYADITCAGNSVSAVAHQTASTILYENNAQRPIGLFSRGTLQSLRLATMNFYA